MAAHVHMITGLTGAGKSTYAETLRLSLGAVRFSIDDRNARQGKTFALTVTRKMFDFMETIWEPPDQAEMAVNNGVRVGD